MNRIALISVVALATVAFTTAPGAAMHGGCNGNVITVEVGSESLYIDDRADDPNAPPGSGFFFGEGTWLYLEANNIDGYQSGGTNPWYNQQPLLSGIDNCDHANPDQILF